MGMSCVTIGGAGASKTLRERYGDQKLQRCRYSDIPASIQAPVNVRKGEGRYMLMTCLEGIDFDTYSGGTNRAMALSIVFVPNGTDIADRHNGITDFLWDQFDDGEQAQMPVPFLRTRPNITPIVGVPTFFTFRWLDPGTKGVVAEGPYAGRGDGGPFKQITTGDVVMRAEATSITIDPNQQGIAPVTCDPSTPYVRVRREEPAGGCLLDHVRAVVGLGAQATRPSRSPTTSRTRSTPTSRSLAGQLRRRRRRHARSRQRLHDARPPGVPVQEVQAPNQPPAVIY